MTRKAALAFGIGASLLLAAGAANAAGTCATEVQALQQQLGATESPNATIGPTSPGTQQPAPQANSTTGSSSSTMNNDQVASQSGANATTGTHTTVPTGSSNDNGSSVTSQDNTGANATIGPTSPGVQQPQNQDMSSNSDTYGSSGSSNNMSSGSSGSSNSMSSGTVTNTSRSGELNLSASSRAAALTSLKKAELYAKAGEENACMVELNTAKQRMGVQ